MSKQTKRPTKWEGLQIVHPNAAGLDIGSSEIYACVPPGRANEPVRKFGTFTPDLTEMADWLAACGVDTVAMEPTGVYWIPAYETLEARGFDVRTPDSTGATFVTPVRDTIWQPFADHGIGEDLLEAVCASLDHS